MASEIIPWTALAVSFASFGLSIYGFIRNTRLTMQQKKMELLTKMSEVQIQYEEINRILIDLCSNLQTIPQDIAESVITYNEFKKNSNEYYDFAYKNKISDYNIDQWKHHIDSMLLHIASDKKYIDEWKNKNSKLLKTGN
jgi:hypothetical protein